MKTVILKGGLGNQLFQISLFLKLTNEFKREKVLLDNKTGFILDYKYRRKYELPIRSDYLKYIKFNSIFLNLISLIIEKFFPFLKVLLPFEIINDKEKYLLNPRTNKNLLYNGYFQKYEIVKSVAPKLNSIIEPYLNQNTSKNFNDLYEKIKTTCNPVALCIRFYEETNNPNAYTSDGKPKKPSDFNRIIKQIESLVNSPTFFIFVQEENKFTKQLELNSNYDFITPKKGYLDAWQTLKAQALCKHHIFNNSTYYWWGSMISKIYYKKNIKDNSYVFVADNFLNNEIYSPDWIKF
tara:strand:- start:1265 stop:2149 length:885 start_codon:yes stop_codon:yes gene_type:complete